MSLDDNNEVIGKSPPRKTDRMLSKILQKLHRFTPSNEVTTENISEEDHGDEPVDESDNNDEVVMVNGNNYKNYIFPG